jgi:hypothetical protein
MTPRLKHRLEYGAFRAALGALNTLPPAVARSVGAGVASFGFRPLRRHRSGATASPPSRTRTSVAR